MATDITNAEIDQLLREAAERLQDGSTTSRNRQIIKAPKAELSEVKKSQDDTSVSDKTNDHHNADAKAAEKLAVRVAETKEKATLESKKKKDNAGTNWFNLPKTDMTPQFKRDWQLLRMSNILDPRHHKKAISAAPPAYSQVGEVVSGPLEKYSARLTKKDRKRTMFEEAMVSFDKSKMKTKYAGIQKTKASGKKGFYKKLVAQRRKN